MKVDVCNVSRDGMPLDVTVRGEAIGEVRSGLWVAGDVRFAGRVAKCGDDMLLRGTARCTFRTACSRCLDEFDQDVSVSVTATYVLDDAVHDPGADGECIEEQRFTYDGTELDLVPSIRDELVLEAPVKPLCSPECRGLCPGCGANLNRDACKCREMPTDSRLAAFKDAFGRLDT